MPATEQTWRDIKWMHVLFGVSGVAMLATTIWMLAADHNREWKPVQRKFREIETWYTQAKINDSDSAEYVQKKADLEKFALPVLAFEHFEVEAHDGNFDGLRIDIDAEHAGCEQLAAKLR